MAAETPGSDAAPKAGQPRMFGGHLEPKRLPWSWATVRLETARNYWIATTRSTGRPHARPVWGIWLEDTFYFSTGSLAAQNLAANPAITLHLESGSEVVIIEGMAEPVTDEALVERIVHQYNAKYNWDLDLYNLPDPFLAVRPEIAFGWIADASGQDQGSAFNGTATRWSFARRPTQQTAGAP
jgi:hypothetical protein